jgi:hypothetical protein
LIMCIFICMLFCLIFLLWLGFAYSGWLFNDFVCVFGWFWLVGLIVSACDVFFSCTKFFVDKSEIMVQTMKYWHIHRHIETDNY